MKRAELERLLARSLSWGDARRAVRTLSDALGGETVYVPRAPRVDRGAVREAVGRGRSFEAVGAAHGVSVRTVRRIVRGR